MVHVYWGSDPQILWGIVDKHVPDLRGKVDRWIEKCEKDLKDRPEPEKTEKKEGKLSRKIRELAEKEHSQPEDMPPLNPKDVFKLKKPDKSKEQPKEKSKDRDRDDDLER